MLRRVAFVGVLGGAGIVAATGQDGPRPAEPPAELQQADPDPTIAGRIERLRRAHEAVLRGDLAEGVREAEAAAALKTSVKGRSLALVQVEHLLILSYGLRNENETKRAGEVALLAVERLRAVQLKLAAREQGDALVMEGEIYEHLAVDREKALAAYLEALAAYPASEAARRGVERLEATEAQDLVRREENELAARRAIEDARREKGEVSP